MFIWSYLINYSVHLRSPRFVAHTFVSLDIHRSDVIKPRDSEVSYFNYHINQTFVLFSVISVFSLSLTNGKIRHVLDYVKYKNSECILKKIYYFTNKKTIKTAKTPFEASRTSFELFPWQERTLPQVRNNALKILSGILKYPLKNLEKPCFIKRHSTISKITNKCRSFIISF